MAILRQTCVVRHRLLVFFREKTETRLPELRHRGLYSSGILLLEKTIMHGESDSLTNEKLNNSCTEFIPLCNTLFQNPLQAMCITDRIIWTSWFRTVASYAPKTDLAIGKCIR